jgi:hypothetical protein
MYRIAGHPSLNRIGVETCRCFVRACGRLLNIVASSEIGEQPLHEPLDAAMAVGTLGPVFWASFRRSTQAGLAIAVGRDEQDVVLPATKGAIEPSLPARLSSRAYPSTALVAGKISFHRDAPSRRHELVCIDMTSSA